MSTANFFRASTEEFKNIPGAPIAYWVSYAYENAFSGFKSMSEIGQTSKGIITGDNGRFMRNWWEITWENVGLGIKDSHDGVASRKKWFPCNKGGEYRKWYGNNDFVIDWGNNGYAVMHPSPGETRHCQDYYEWCKFRQCVSWTSISSSRPSFRYKQNDLVDHAGMAYFMRDDANIKGVLGFANSKVASSLLRILSPTLNFNAGEIGRLPINENAIKDFAPSEACILKAKSDWDAYETSWDFAVNPLVALCEGEVDSVQCAVVRSDHSPLSTLYAQLREKWAKDCEEMRRLETENNRIFIEAYGLQDELTPEVPWNEITLTCNPFYRYAAKSEECGVQSTELPRVSELEERLKGDTVKELISYAVGCMMGRYSLEKPGLILADQGANETDYYAKIGVDKEHAKFQVDDDSIIPILDNDWFEDDIVTRFKAFIKVAFGEEHFFENMAWIEEALGKDIRSYFTKDFYKDHLQRYQNRPIYWLFQSPKGAFRALVYMHRYKPDMVGGVLGYLRSLQTKVDNQLDVAMRVGADESKSASERVRANKDAVKHAKAKKELDEYEKNVLYPLSTERIEIDLDDGVKVNYKKFGIALKKVAALE